jgi:hypothetical protein
MGDGKMNSRLQDLVGSEAWQTVQEPSTFFTPDDRREISLVYLHYVKATRKEDELVIEWPRVSIHITGPKVGELHKDFAKGRATHIKADGVDILSVKVILG